MTSAEYESWVEQHCEATAATAEAALSLGSAITRRAFEEWGATVGELGECTYRLIHGRRVPKFANEHADAVAVELLAIRKEAQAAAQDDANTALPIGAPVPDAPACRWCRDTGLVVVPLWRCVEVPRYGPPRLVAYPGYKAVLTGSVLCDAPGCRPGHLARDAARRSEKPRPTLTRYLSRFSGADVLGLLERHEREVVEVARRRPGADDGAWALLVERLKARAGGTYTEGGA